MFLQKSFIIGFIVLMVWNYKKMKPKITDKIYILTIPYCTIFINDCITSKNPISVDVFCNFVVNNLNYGNRD